MLVDPEVIIQPEETMEIYPGVTCEWFLERKIVAYRLTMVSQMILEKWSEFVIETLDRWPEETPYLALHDLATPGMSLQYASLVSFDTTNLGVIPAKRYSTRALVADRRLHGTRVAVNFNFSLSGKINKALSDRRQVPSLITYRTFYNRPRALAWLGLALDGGDNGVEATDLTK